MSIPTVHEKINQYFQEYSSNAEQNKVILSSSKPPEPLYTAPRWYGAILKGYIFDTVLYGAPLMVAYTVIRFSLSIISKKISPPPLPSYAWTLYKWTSPLFAYRVAQIILSILIHPSAVMWYVNANRKGAEDMGFPTMRVAARSGTGHLIDGVLVNVSPESKKYLLVSPGNQMWYESEIQNESFFIPLAQKLQANILFYNYPGVGASSGVFPNRDAMVASHEAMVGLLEEMGGEKVYDFGWSIGGGVKWADYANHPERDSKKYCVIDYQTFHSTANIGRELFGRIGELAVKFLQWNYDCDEAIKSASCQHIIVQDGDSKTNQVFDDGVMSVENALATGADQNKVILMNTREIYNFPRLRKFVHGAPLDEGTIDRIGSKVQ